MLYPDGDRRSGRNPARTTGSRQARRTGQARVDDVERRRRRSWCRSRSAAAAAAPGRHPVIRVVRARARPGVGRRPRAGWCWPRSGSSCSLGALLLADRLGRSFVRPIGGLADLRRAGSATADSPARVVDGPPEVRELGRGAEPARRPRSRCCWSASGRRSPTCPTGCGRRSPRCGCASTGVADPAERERLGGGPRRAPGDGRPRGPRGPALRARGAGRRHRRRWRCSPSGPRFWAPLAEDQDRVFTRRRHRTRPVPVRASEADLVAAARRAAGQRLHPHPRRARPSRSRSRPRPGGGLVLVVEDDGPGFPDGRRRDAAGAPAARARRVSGWRSRDRPPPSPVAVSSWDASPTGGARAVVTLGPPA